MKKMNVSKMEKITGNGEGQDFISGFACAAGLLTSTTGLGIALAIAGCSSLFGDW
ncbi:hypothetical protein [Flavobacterium sp.]|uniref:hypothetical protein n=1 Tax=Flavobacterium sp. TaxID=239 RepID=UPI00404769EA